MSHNELLQQSQILNELPLQQQPVIVNQNPVKMPNLVLENDGVYFHYCNFVNLLTYCVNFFLQIKFWMLLI